MHKLVSFVDRTRGTGAITTVLQRVTSTDITDHGLGPPGVDFLSCQAVRAGWRAKGQESRRGRALVRPTG